MREELRKGVKKPMCTWAGGTGWGAAGKGHQNGRRILEPPKSQKRNGCSMFFPCGTWLGLGKNHPELFLVEIGRAQDETSDSLKSASSSSKQS